MIDSIEHIVIALKAAREKKGLTQRALSRKIKISQSHLSKIENGSTDLQCSTLVEISRTVDLELMLVPRQVVPTVQALLRGAKKDSKRQIPSYRIDSELDEENEDE